MEDKKKIIILTAAIVGIFLLIILIGFVILPAISNMAAKKNVPENNVGDTSISNNDNPLSLEEQAKQIFNDFYTSYETKDGETLPAASIAMLFSTLANQNDSNDRKVDANGVIVTKNNLELQKEILSDEMRYKVKCIYDDEGYVKTVEIRYTPTTDNNASATDQGATSQNDSTQEPTPQNNGGQTQEGQQAQ